MEKSEIVSFLEDQYDDHGFLLLDGFEDAFIGIVYGHSREPVTWKKCIENLMAQGMSEEDAEEYFSFNVEGAYVGESTPVFLIGV